MEDAPASAAMTSIHLERRELARITAIQTGVHQDPMLLDSLSRIVGLFGNSKQLQEQIG